MGVAISAAGYRLLVASIKCTKVAFLLDRVPADIMSKNYQTNDCKKQNRRHYNPVFILVITLIIISVQRLILVPAIHMFRSLSATSAITAPAVTASALATPATAAPAVTASALASPAATVRAMTHAPCSGSCPVQLLMLYL